MPESSTDRRQDLPVISRRLLAFFRFIVRGYFRRHFHGVRLSGTEHLQGLSGPLIVYANHSSWWDPMIAYLLAAELFGDRNHYAPMDASALERYPVLRRLGVFPVEMQTLRGAANFLRLGRSILRAGGVLWITPQGRFVDNRQRPLVFKPGLAALAARSGPCTLLPLSIEYTFWDERQPEVLLCLGEPISISGETAPEIEPRLVSALERTMGSLQQLALTRNPHAFERLLSFNPGGTGGLYGIAQRLRALALRKPYQAEHTPAPHREAAPR